MGPGGGSVVREYNGVERERVARTSLRIDVVAEAKFRYYYRLPERLLTRVGAECGSEGVCLRMEIRWHGRVHAGRSTD